MLLGVRHASPWSRFGRNLVPGAMICRLKLERSMWFHRQGYLADFSWLPYQPFSSKSRFSIYYYSILIHIHYSSVINGEFRQYKGSRDMNSFMTFVEEKKWQALEPISSWKKPDSIPMSVLSWFFRLSHFLKVIKIEVSVTLLLGFIWGKIGRIHVLSFH